MEPRDIQWNPVERAFGGTGIQLEVEKAFSGTGMHLEVESEKHFKYSGGFHVELEKESGGTGMELEVELEIPFQLLWSVLYSIYGAEWFSI